MTSAQAVRLQKQGYRITVQAAWHKKCPEVTHSPRGKGDVFAWVTESGKRYRLSQLNTWN
ncbi:hypothetical protein [Streptomyces marianii]|uniref:Uncharacterized protein n=1 Tax=Streptomyces marianii TaxID=1817406 RepID=A0A5R9E0S1_9ACTN|nr:hypothetical protein [Streptomyces marianii]TLQ43470.1 hypothetical protein FEF34_10220 [Streptomyces marianii]